MRFQVPDSHHENTRTIGDGPPLADTFSPKIAQDSPHQAVCVGSRA
jgi:hypothetical protein